MTVGLLAAVLIDLKPSSVDRETTRCGGDLSLEMEEILFGISDEPLIGSYKVKERIGVGAFSEVSSFMTCSLLHFCDRQLWRLGVITYANFPQCQARDSESVEACATCHRSSRVST